MTPHWEHGYRCHGYWLENRRVGCISLPPFGFPLVYHWSMDYPKEYTSYGKCDNLGKAKRCVEKAWASGGAGESSEK